MTTQRVTEMTPEEKDFIMDLLTKNMKSLYEQSEWGWNEKSKKEEMFEDNAWYLLAKNKEGDIAGFSHFRFDMDYDDEVVYVYEIQLKEEYRRKGLGRFMMQGKRLKKKIATPIF